MNRILFEREEIVDGCVTFGGVRAEHVLGILHGEIGQTLKTGEVNGLVGTSEIVAIEAAAPTVTVRVNHTMSSLAPWVDLILAPPRPRVMKRLLPQLASLGIGRLFLVGAKKVEKDFWGATLLKEENWRPLFVEGLMQAGTSALPTLETRRNFRKFVNEEVESLWPTGPRLVAHPYGAVLSSDGTVARPLTYPGGTVARPLTYPGGTVARPLTYPDGTVARPSPVWQSERQLSPPDGIPPPAGRLLLAIGPEGGWTDEEVALLEAHGFVRRSLGPRILRTDTATVALLAQLLPTDTVELPKTSVAATSPRPE